MENGTNNQIKETSLYIRQNLISPDELERSSRESKSQIRDEVLDTYLKYYSSRMENKFSRKNLMRFSYLGLAAFVVTVGVGLVVLNNKSEKQESETVATTLKAEITFTEGDVEIMLADGRWADLGEESTLEEGDSFRVVGEGKGILTIDDGSAVRLGTDTTINLTSMDPMNIVITNEGGEVYTRMNASERQFTVETADASYKSLGTAYKTVQKEKEKGVYVYESKVEVESSNVDKVIVNEGEKLLLNDKTDVKEIVAKDLDNDFSKWNKEQDKKEFGAEAAVFKKLEASKTVEKAKPTTSTPEPTNTPAPAPTSNPSISLGGHAEGNGIKLNWVPTDVDASQGFKVVFSKTNSNPTFGSDDSAYYSDPASRNAFVQKNDGQTYYFRVCRYTGSGCDTYSNVMTIVAPGNVQGVQTGVNSLSLSSIAQNKVGWSVNGNAPQGVKVVWSKNAGPTFPTRAGDNVYYNGANGNSYQYLDPFAGAGTYYVRVCEYTGSGCGVYSNEVTITLN